MIITVTIVGLIGATLLGLLTLLRADVQQTRLAAQKAQLRQILAAGGRIVDARMKEWPNDAPHFKELFELPTTMLPENSLLFIEVEPGAAAVEVVITASIDGATAHQSLTYRRDDARWHPTQSLLQ